MENNKPIHKIRFGGVIATIWNNSKDDKPFYTTTINKRYKASDGEWKNSASITLSDLPLVAKVADEAHTYIYCELLGKDE